MKTNNLSAYISPKSKEIATQVAEILCRSLLGSTNNEDYTEELYEW